MDSEIQKPLLPKRLASKIYAAQAKVESARYNIIYDDESIAQDEERIAEYEENPVLFASRYYGTCSHDSYPVQTNISRCRDALERRLGRREERKRELLAAEKNLEITEIEVLNEVAAMRKGTKGRVPWPRSIRSLEKLRSIEKLKAQRDEREWKRKRALELAELEAQIQEDEEKAKAEEEAAHLEWDEELAKMSPREREEVRKYAQTVLAALDSGAITGVQIINLLRENQLKPNNALQHRSGTSYLRWTDFKSRFCGSLRSIYRKITT